MKLKQRTGRTKKTQAFDVAMLKQPEVETAFDIEVYNRFAILDSVDSVEDTWSQFKTTIVAAAEKVVGGKEALGRRGGSRTPPGRPLMNASRSRNNYVRVN